MTPQASSQLPPSTEVTPPVATSPKPVTTAPVVVGPTVLEPKGPSTVQVPPPAAIKPEPATSKAAVMASTPKVQVAAPDVAAPVVAQAPVAVSKPIATLPVKKPTVPTAVTSAPIPPAAVAAKSKSSKKKKNPPLVTMATAATATSGGPGTQGENTGRWTAEEHRLFLQGLEQHGKGWKKIASLIKSRTVVQIRTHAQKYFQKLSKARQNGEEGEISMEGRGGPASVTSGGLTGTGIPTGKRRRQTTGTKRKAISSVVVSATREGKNIAAAQAAAGVAGALPPLPAVAPALAPFVVPPPQPSANSSSNIPVSTYHGAISGPALEDSLYVPNVYLIVCESTAKPSANFLSFPFTDFDSSHQHLFMLETILFKSTRLLVKQAQTQSPCLLKILPASCTLLVEKSAQPASPTLLSFHPGRMLRTCRLGTPRARTSIACSTLPTLLTG
jgi:SHAQKYF class myb-like DNA-binding protein